jgi:phospholipid/cholesterol/gamma-HCH transport system ATP-binding protein
LDPVIGHAILSLIHDCQGRLDFTGIIVTHEIPKIFDYVDRVIMLHEGVVWAEGSPKALIQSRDPMVQKFVGEDAACYLRHQNA